MYRKALALSLLGVLVMGIATIGYGTAFGDGFAQSLGAVMGQDDDDHDDDRKRKKNGHDRHD